MFALTNPSVSIAACRTRAPERRRARSAVVARAGEAPEARRASALASATLAGALLFAPALTPAAFAESLPEGPAADPAWSEGLRAAAVRFAGPGAPVRSDFVDLDVAMAELAARLEPDADVLAALRGARVLAFAGIGDPEKFFRTLDTAGIEIAARRGFPDHHRYSASEATGLLRAADADGLVLVTTEKDFARLDRDGPAAALRARARALPARLALGAGFADFLRARLRPGA